MAGYSQTPLERKLGLVNARGVRPSRAAVVDPPSNYRELLGEFAPEAIDPAGSSALEWVQAFCTDEDQLRARFPELRDRLTPAGQLWICWPKKSSGRQTSLTETLVREIGLATGLVDVKVAAVDETWSGLKFVRRLTDR